MNLPRRSPNLLKAVQLASATVLASSFLAVLTPAQTLTDYDDFNGKQIDPKLWYLDGSRTLLSQSGGLLRVKKGPNKSCTTIISVWGFRGDFDFRLDYRNFKATTQSFSSSPSCRFWLAKGFPLLSLEVWDALPSRGDTYVSIDRRFTGKGHEFGSEQWQKGKPLGSKSTPVSNNTAGQLRVTRVTTGLVTTLSALYSLDGGKTWVTLVSYNKDHLGPIVTLQVSTYSGDNGAFSVDCDWIKYAGTKLSSAPRRYGTACHGLQAGAVYFPFRGSTQFGIIMDGAKPFAPLIGIVGISAISLSWGSGCYLNASPDFLVLAKTANKTGQGGYFLSIPNNPKFMGIQLFSQLVAVDPQLKAPVLCFSEGVAFTIL